MLATKSQAQMYSHSQKKSLTQEVTHTHTCKTLVRQLYIYHKTAVCASQDGGMSLTNQLCVFTKLPVYCTIAMHTLLYTLLFGTLVVAITIVYM